MSAEKVRVAVQQVKLSDPDPDVVAQQKAHWKDALGRLAAAVG